jgi:hypothetical protein
MEVFIVLGILFIFTLIAAISYITNIIRLFFFRDNIYLRLAGVFIVPIGILIGFMNIEEEPTEVRIVNSDELKKIEPHF